MAKMSMGELKLELLNTLLDLIGFDGEEYNSVINKAKTLEDLDKVVNLIIEKQNNNHFEKQMVMFWRKVR